MTFFFGPVFMYSRIIFVFCPSTSTKILQAHEYECHLYALQCLVWLQKLWPFFSIFISYFLWQQNHPIHYWNYTGNPIHSTSTANGLRLMLKTSHWTTNTLTLCCTEVKVRVGGLYITTISLFPPNECTSMEKKKTFLLKSIVDACGDPYFLKTL